MDLAFNKRMADKRKEWLGAYDAAAVLDPEQPRVAYEEFVHRELIHFSKYDLERSIPSLVDGLKTSQRKILYACFKRNLVGEEVRVAQLAGYVSEHAAYHHGEASLQGAIVSMAQGFVGSNNLALLRPLGQFGTRILGGKDAASPRYIHTLLSPLAPKLFPPRDTAVLPRVDDDGQLVEPEYYAPVLPMVLVNGAVGIGTAFSTNVPCYDPADVLAALERKLRGEGAGEPLRPWYRGFKGHIVRAAASNGAFLSVGCAERVAADTVRVTELPVGVWTEDYKGFLDTYMEANPRVLHRVRPAYTEEDAVFELHFHKGALPDAWFEPATGQHAAPGVTRLHVELRLVSNRGLSVSNMHLFDDAGAIRKFDNPEAIVDAYVDVRLRVYEARRQHELRALKRVLTELENKMRFVQGVIDGDIVVHRKSRAEIAAQLVARKFAKVDGSFDYLTGMPILSLSSEKVLDLQRAIDAGATEADALRVADARTLWLAELAALKPMLSKTEGPTGEKPAPKKRSAGTAAKPVSKKKR
jgi:DNA topoisomerase-2